MIGIVLGVLTIILGAKAFTPKGLPVTSKQNLTGKPAKIIGVICIILGALFFIEGLFGTARIFALFSGR